MQSNSLIRPVILLAGLLAATALRAGWMNLTGAETAPNIAEITVLDDQVRVVLEVYIDDLERFEALVPDDWLQGSGSQRPPLKERLRRFSDTGLQFVTGTGEKLQARSATAPCIRTTRMAREPTSSATRSPPMDRSWGWITASDPPRSPSVVDSRGGLKKP